MSLTDRERDFENRFIHDQELRFRIEARRNKLVALWAAEKLGMPEPDARTYAQDVVRASFMKAGDNDVFEKIRDDLAKGKVQQSDHQVRRTIEEMLLLAERQVMAE
ncbi:DUF1476 domain-containing protein [Aureimonas leprariae]|uniref:DUF1476 domain-containing protein n=1 Tax=Plantimonas leprariae TaxID=2615207 RepID=A0A7V7PR22_9HYPH|nr:DUF1476 domain-containing protein [Aureimonas leprariae]KAB0680885.1 DUF1476 domain-containing protein [Aureimonas leprariae]